MPLDCALVSRAPRGAGRRPSPSSPAGMWPEGSPVAPRSGESRGPQAAPGGWKAKIRVLLRKSPAASRRDHGGSARQPKQPGGPPASPGRHSAQQTSVRAPARTKHPTGGRNRSRGAPVPAITPAAFTANGRGPQEQEIQGVSGCSDASMRRRHATKLGPGHVAHEQGVDASQLAAYAAVGPMHLLPSPSGGSPSSGLTPVLRHSQGVDEAFAEGKAQRRPE